MFTKKSDYQFADVANIDIRGDIIPTFIDEPAPLRNEDFYYIYEMVSWWLNKTKPSYTQPDNNDRKKRLILLAEEIAQKVPTELLDIRNNISYQKIVAGRNLPQRVDSEEYGENGFWVSLPKEYKLPRPVIDQPSTFHVFDRQRMQDIYDFFLTPCRHCIMAGRGDCAYELVSGRMEWEYYNSVGARVSGVGDWDEQIFPSVSWEDVVGRDRYWVHALEIQNRAGGRVYISGIKDFECVLDLHRTDIFMAQVVVSFVAWNWVNINHKFSYRIYPMTKVGASTWKCTVPDVAFAKELLAEVGVPAVESSTDWLDGECQVSIDQIIVDYNQPFVV